MSQTTICPLNILVTLILFKEDDGWVAEANDHPETRFISQYKQEAIDGALDLARRQIHRQWG